MPKISTIQNIYLKGSLFYGFNNLQLHKCLLKELRIINKSPAYQISEMLMKCLRCLKLNLNRGR
jgi:hypothetical protein